MKIIQDPFKTTIKGINLTSGNVKPILTRIQDKLFTYGILSDKESAFLNKYINNNRK